MPLIKNASNEARDENIRELIHSGRDEKQAAAIAYSVQRKASGKKAKPSKKPHGNKRS